MAPPSVPEWDPHYAALANVQAKAQAATEALRAARAARAAQDAAQLAQSTAHAAQAAQEAMQAVQEITQTAKEMPRMTEGLHLARLLEETVSEGANMAALAPLVQICKERSSTPLPEAEQVVKVIQLLNVAKGAARTAQLAARYAEDAAL